MQKRTSILIIVLIIIALLVILGGVFAYKYFTKQNVDQTTVWKTYTSQKLGVSFKYPNNWGDIKEKYYDSVTDKKVEIDAQGKKLSITFSKYSNIAIIALSSDYADWDGLFHFLYRGDVSLQEMYNKEINPKSEPIYFNFANKIAAIQFIYTNFGPMSGIGDSIFQRGIKVYAKPIGSNFGGILINEGISLRTGKETQQEQIDFITKFKNNELDKTTQDKIDEFNLFISSFKPIE